MSYLSTLSFFLGVSRISHPVLLFLLGNSRNLYGPFKSRYMNNHINMLFQGCPVARSCCMKRILLTQSTLHTNFNPFVTSSWQTTTKLLLISAQVRRKLNRASVEEMGGIYIYLPFPQLHRYQQQLGC